MIVKLLAHTPDADRVCAAAARSCYSAKPAGELYDTMKDPAKFLANVVAMGHHSVIEHAVFTFSVEGVSRSLTHQLVRHRIASYSQQSQRYVSLNTPDYVVPEEIAKNPEAKKIFDDLMQQIWDTYNKLEDLGIIAEDARYVLPNACTTNITVTMNDRDQAAGRRDAEALQGGLPQHLRLRRTLLRQGALPRGREMLRPLPQGGVPDSQRGVRCPKDGGNPPVPALTFK